MGELSKLPNIGKAVEEQLNQVGIDTAEKLREIGAKAAWLEIQKVDELHTATFRGRQGRVLRPDRAILSGQFYDWQSRGFSTLPIIVVSY